MRNANSSSFLTPFGGDFVDFGGICWSREARRLVRLLRAERAWGAGGLYLLTEGKLIFVRNISHLCFLSCRPPRDLDSKACISIGEKVRPEVTGMRRPLGTGDHPGLAACPDGLLVELLNFSQKKGQINKHSLFKNCGLFCVKWEWVKARKSQPRGLCEP